MPSFEQVSFTSPLKDALLARHQPGPEDTTPGTAGEEIPERPARQTLVAEEVLKAQTGEAYRKGLQEGRAQEKKSQTAALAAMKGQLESVLRKIAAKGDDLAAELEELLPELVIEGVGRVMHTLQPDAEAVKAIVHELLQGIDTDDRNLRLSLHPRDADLLEQVDPDLGSRFPGLSLVRDDDLQPGECYLESRFGIADARFSAKLNNLRKVLE